MVCAIWEEVTEKPSDIRCQEWRPHTKLEGWNTEWNVRSAISMRTEEPQEQYQL